MFVSRALCLCLCLSLANATYDKQLSSFRAGGAAFRGIFGVSAGGTGMVKSATFAPPFEVHRPLPLWFSSHTSSHCILPIRTQPLPSTPFFYTAFPLFTLFYLCITTPAHPICSIHRTSQLTTFPPPHHPDVINSHTIDHDLINAPLPHWPLCVHLLDLLLLANVALTFFHIIRRDSF